VLISVNVEVIRESWSSICNGKMQKPLNDKWWKAGTEELPFVTKA